MKYPNHRKAYSEAQYITEEANSKKSICEHFFCRLSSKTGNIENRQSWKIAIVNIP